MAITQVSAEKDQR